MARASHARQIAITKEAHEIFNEAFKRLVNERLCKADFELIIHLSCIRQKLDRCSKDRQQSAYAFLDGLLAALYLMEIITVDDDGNEFWNCGKVYVTPRS